MRGILRIELPRVDRGSHPTPKGRRRALTYILRVREAGSPGSKNTGTGYRIPRSPQHRVLIPRGAA